MAAATASAAGPYEGGSRLSWQPTRYLPHMERAFILSSLAASGTGTAPQRLTELAAELDIPAADLLVVAGHLVPAELLPPERDARVMRQFAYRVSHCNHSQLAALEAFVRSLPRVAAREPLVQPTWPGRRPAQTRFAAMLGALIRNRGFGIRELPFMGLSLSTLHGMMWRWDPSPHRRQQLSAVAGPLGWTLPDLFAVADEPYSEGLRPMLHCRHLGRVFAAAVPLTTAQLIETAEEADRLSVREDHGVWQPVSQGFAEECPDFP
ncbi:hypothetical protein OG819_53195 [Streptomyces sp. NBC_01549]|uniref:hypothetical protein n=1 Tax=Streptomyces sp. NBC_01549 TaxID=2975874 RepID=UPI00225B1405|nr:hypothetical protein [Streptomyces sp. NBC_01549]MCX4597971.1 hypothetical protein [Streptomyces sp. NBC_01549]